MNYELFISFDNISCMGDIQTNAVCHVNVEILLGFLTKSFSFYKKSCSDFLEGYPTLFFFICSRLSIKQLKSCSPRLHHGVYRDFPYQHDSNYRVSLKNKEISTYRLSLLYQPRVTGMKMKVIGQKNCTGFENLTMSSLRKSSL